ncbi:DUF58 domain-containing protein [Microbacterium oryzae]|uniref:DUF58 domain-containing protein n=1 Tax=Microbacterium oryzae TaxID=743009 RepID=UPI0025AF6089|nr:DUF58 domain-containing protein [Microbacterium oryzae]MDN3309904.1 DUF58 domain-containing protein [Microbacterium oryzae]
MHVTGRLAALAAFGIVPVVLLGAAGADPWLVLAVWVAVCTAAVAVDVAAAADPRALRMDRAIPPRVRLGEAAEAVVRLVNTGSRRLRGWVRDGWQPTAGAQPARLAVDVPPGETRSLRVRLAPRRRGELRTAFVAVRSTGPLGLAGRQRVLDAPGAIRVLPPFRSRRHLPSRIARLRELDGSTSVQMRGQGTEFDSLRPYVRGDDVRSIDWRATARAGTTMLRTWRPERDRHIVVVLDTGRTAAARVGDSTRLDAAVEAALLLAALAQRAGDHVHLVAFDRRVRARVSGAEGPALLPALVDALSPVDAQLIDTDWDAALAQARRLAPHPSLLVLLTAQESSDAARGFLGALPGAARRGTTVLVASATDSTPADAARGHGTSDALYRAAAAEAALAAVDQVARAVERAGAQALTAPPDDLPPRLADRYLDLKRTGRL